MTPISVPGAIEKRVTTVSAAETNAKSQASGEPCQSRQTTNAWITADPTKPHPDE
jgi:hypothetical protein